MSEKKLLVKFDSNYADEFDVAGFMVMTETQWEHHKVDAAKCFEQFEKLPQDKYGRRIGKYGGATDGIEVYFGTNEQMIYETLESYLDQFSVSEVSDSEIAVLEKFFNRYDGVKFGMLPMLEYEEDED